MFVGCTVSFSTRHWSFCNGTLSSKSYREWPFGVVTDVRYKKSPLETRLEKIGVRVTHDWSNGTTGYDSLGSSNSHGCPAMTASVRIRPYQLDSWLEAHSDKDVVALYSLLSTRNYTAIEKRVEEIIAEVS
jgi:hypothetical protein